MFLYNVTLQKAQAITQAIFGNFSAPKAQEIVVSRGKILELLRPDDETGKVQSICQMEVFGVIRSILSTRLEGGNRDYIIVGSDSGRISILQYSPEKSKFVKIHEETFGKSGCRRIVPGQFLATDPKGRAVMIGAVEKQKFVYVLNRDTSANLTISSPLEAHKSHNLCLSMCGMDVGFENPMFACIEVDYDRKLEGDEKNPIVPKQLVFYELDLGLNHVTRKFSEETDSGANLVIPVPGGAQGPGGVLVCCENLLIYKNVEHQPLKVPLPRRFGVTNDKGILVVSYAVHTQKNLFFFLIQTEYGDIYKVSITYEEDTVEDVIVKYFDTVAPCTSMCVLKTGFLFCASEFGNHYLFQFQGIGEDDETAFTSTKTVDVVYFNPRVHTNIALVDEMESLSPIMDMKVADLAGEHTPQIYTLCGSGPRSSLRVLRHGLAVTEMAVSELPGNPNAVWAVKKNAADAFCSYIVVSFVNATIVLSIGETVTEVSDSGILDSTPTMSLSLLGDNSLLQIHPSGIRHIRSDKRINEWKAPGKKSITQCAVNERQVLIGLSGGELVYFELDRMGALMDVHRKEMGNDIACLAIGPVPEGRQRSGYMVVGLVNNTVRVLSLDPSSPMGQLTVQALPALPHTVLLANLTGLTGRDVGQLYLYVGLTNGILMRSMLDDATGSLVDPRKRFLGTRPVKLFRVVVHNTTAVMALSSRSWLSYIYQSRFHMTPLSYELLEHASSFSSEQCNEGIVCVSGNTLRIVTVERLGELFNQTIVPLRYTPRKFTVHPITNQLIIIESDHNAYSFKVKKELQAALTEDDDNKKDEPKVKQEDSNGMSDEKKEDEKAENGDKKKADAPSEIFTGAPQAGVGKWASCIRIVDPVTGSDVYLEELEDNEAAFSLTTVKFGKDENELYLAVGTAKDMIISPRSMSSGFIRLYKFINNNSALQFCHKTPVTDVPLTMVPFQRRLLAGVGKFLRIYDLGKRKLLRKCENKNFPTSVISIHVVGERIYAADMAESFHYVKYNKNEKQLNVLADSISPRYISATCLVDFATFAVGDKFGNICLQRLPMETTDSIERDPTGGITSKFGHYLGGAAYKMTDIAQFHVGETITSLHKTSLVPGGSECLFYSTIMGGLGVCIPFTTREDIDFFSHLEMHCRQEFPPLCGRDHLAYRSYYGPIKETIDGDLCEMYTTLTFDRQQAIAEELVSTPSEISKKLEEMRNRIL